MDLPLNRFPFDMDSELRKAIQYHQLGQLQKAEKIYTKILEINANHSDCLHLLGIIAYQNGKNEIAEDLISKAIQNNPKIPIYHNNLGAILKDQGILDEAISCYQKALNLKPDYAEAYYNMGVAYQDRGKVDEAISYYQNAIQLKPDYAEAYYNMGVVHQDQNKLDEAIAYFQNAIQLKPDYAEAYCNMGNAILYQKKLDEAISCYQKALNLKPDYAEAYYNMGVVHQDQNKLDEAISYYQNAIQLKPDYTEAYCNMGNAFLYQGKTNEAISCYQNSLQIRYDFGVEANMALSLPVIYESKQKIEESRRKIMEQIERLKNKGLTLKDPVKQVGLSNFYLAYQGLNDKEIHTTLASLYNHVCPDLAWVPSNCNQQHRSHNRINLGIISKFLCNHTIGKLNIGILENLSKERFHIKIFRFPGKEDHMSKVINNTADEVVILSNKSRIARKEITDHPLDILFYLDIGMSPLTYLLAFSRLAPVQCVTWGHPVTTGIPNMDYFISTEDLETQESHLHYSEQLIKLKCSPTYYYRPILPSMMKDRDYFGLSKNKHLYLCPQSLFKFHPEFDELLAEILCRDQNGELILIEGKHSHWTELLLNRFRSSIPDVCDRIFFLPRQSYSDFLNLIAVCDVILDTFPFCGGNTTYEGLFTGTPIVTLPSQFLRGRITYAIYRKMGVMDCVASNRKEYVDIAVQLGTDKEYREKVKAKIVTNNHFIYEDIEVVRELEDFFEWAREQAHKQNSVS